LEAWNMVVTPRRLIAALLFHCCNCSPVGCASAHHFVLGRNGVLKHTLRIAVFQGRMPKRPSRTTTPLLTIPRYVIDDSSGNSISPASCAPLRRGERQALAETQSRRERRRECIRLCVLAALRETAFSSSRAVHRRDHFSTPNTKYECGRTFTWKLVRGAACAPPRPPRRRP
jgi:hypothetical protein